MKLRSSFSTRVATGLSAVEWPLLLFLLVFTADMVVLKPVGLLLGLWLYRKKAIGRHLKKAPPMYWLLPAMEVVRFLAFNRDFTSPHCISFAAGLLFWLMAAGAFGVLRAAVFEDRRSRILPTLNAWFWINVLWSLGQLVRIMVLSGSPNPYRLEVEAYGNSTGDFIRGVMGGPSYLNMFVNAFFAVFFLYRRRYGSAAAALVVALLTGSNFGNLIFLPVLLLTGLLLRRRQATVAIGGLLAVYALFYLVIFPSNLSYLSSSLRTPPAAGAELPSLLRPAGKLTSFRQTADMLASDPVKLCFGAGMGNYSSQLAVRTSDLQEARKSRLFRLLPHYIHPAFRADHYRIFQALYRLPPAYHSIRHMPGSFANQLAGEYGLAGILIFAWGYLGYFLRRHRLLSYTWPLLLLACGFLLFDYLFEYLSVMVFFELFFLADIRRQEQGKERMI